MAIQNARWLRPNLPASMSSVQFVQSTQLSQPAPLFEALRPLRLAGGAQDGGHQRLPEIGPSFLPLSAPSCPLVPAASALPCACAWLTKPPWTRSVGPRQTEQHRPRTQGPVARSRRKGRERVRGPVRQSRIYVVLRSWPVLRRGMKLHCFGLSGVASQRETGEPQDIGVLGKGTSG